MLHTICREPTRAIANNFTVYLKYEKNGIFGYFIQKASQDEILRYDLFRKIVALDVSYNQGGVRVLLR